MIALAYASQCSFARRFLVQCSGRLYASPLRPHLIPSPLSRSRQNAFLQTCFGSPTSSRIVGSRPASGITTTMGLFGLGAPEIAVCLVVAAVILGPDKLAGELA